MPNEDESEPLPLRFMPGTNPGVPMNHRVAERFEADGGPDDDDVCVYEYWSDPALLTNESAITRRWGQYLRRLKRRENGRRHG